MKQLSQTQDGSPASAEAVRAALARILGHAAFHGGRRQRELLAYVVEQTLAGRGDRLKAFDLAVAVLGRDEHFDAQNDPIVRIEMGRLRRNLEHYYLSAGLDDPIRITIPKGHYLPVFEVRREAAAPAAMPAAAPGRSHRFAPALLVVPLLLVALAVGVLLRPFTAGGPEPQQRGPSLLITPFEAPGGEGAALLASGLTNQLVADLMRVERLRVYAGGPAPGTPPATLPQVAYRVEGTVQRDASTIRVTSRLVDAATSEVLWSETVDRTADMAGVLAVQDDLAGRIAERLALPNGAIAVAAERPAGSRPQTMFAYDCVQRAWFYRRQSDSDDRAEVIACLDEALDREPGYAEAWAMKSLLHIDGAWLGLVRPEDVDNEVAAGRSAAERAVALAPRNIASLQALARVRYGEGAFAEAERLQREAIALSPHNPESLAQLGWRLWARGRLEEGIALIEDAVARSWRSPVWYHQTLALALFLRGDLERAHAEAVLGQKFCCGMGQATLAITAASLGRGDEARAALEQAVAQSPLLARDPRAFWRVFHLEERLIDRMIAGLRAAGLRAGAATPVSG